MNKKIYYPIIYILSYFFIMIFLNYIFSGINKGISNLLTYILLTTIYILYDYKYLKKCTRNLDKVNYKKNVLVFIIIFTISELVTIFIPKLFNITSPNQESVINLFNDYPLSTFISAALLAPICEEAIFRKNFKNTFTNKWLFSWITGLVFSLFHILSISSLSELIYFPVYLSFGIYLGYIYYESDNILVSLKYHIINNVLSFIFIIFL